MNFILKVVAIMAIGFVLEMFLPWWSIAIAAFTGGLMIQTKASFAAGFLAIAVLWILKAWYIDFSSVSDLPDRVALIFSLKNKTVLFLFTALLGGTVGGFSAMTGALIRSKEARS